MRTLLTAAFVAGSAGLTLPALAAPTIPDDVRTAVRACVDQGYTPGIAVGVIDSTGTSYFCYGSTAADGQSVTEDTVFEIGSITKAFTGILLADLANRGLVKLDDPIDKHLPEGATAPTRNGRSITLLDLATHRSGLPRLPDNMEPANPEDPYVDYDDARLFAFLSGHQLSRDIGAQYEYSNLGMGLLGNLLARAAGTTYEQLVQDRICQPLGMTSTWQHVPDSARARFAQGHSGGSPAAQWGLDALAGAGCLRSSAKDMAAFIAANLSPPDGPLGTALRKATEGRHATSESHMHVALGWHVGDEHGTEIVWHNGGTGGFRSFCGFAPAKGLGVVVLTNSTYEIDDLGRHVLETRFELPRIRTRTAAKLDELDAYLGYYELAPNVVFHVTREGDQLYAQLTGQDRYPVYREDADKYFFQVADAQLTFNRDAGGSVTSLTLHQYGRDQAARRLADYTPPPPRQEVSVPADVLARYVGRYELRPGIAFDVRLEGDHLSVRLTGQPWFPVYAKSQTRFFYKVVEAQLTFTADESGKVTSLTLHQGGMDQTAQRVE